MRFQNALLLACAGSALFVGAVPHDDGTGNAVMSNSGGGKCTLMRASVTRYEIT